MKHWQYFDIIQTSFAIFLTIRAHLDIVPLLQACYVLKRKSIEENTSEI